MFDTSFTDVMREILRTRTPKEQRQYVNELCTCENCGVKNFLFYPTVVYIPHYPDLEVQDDASVFKSSKNVCDDCHLVLTLLDKVIED